MTFTVVKITVRLYLEGAQRLLAVFQRFNHFSLKFTLVREIIKSYITYTEDKLCPERKTVNINFIQ